MEDVMHIRGLTTLAGAALLVTFAGGSARAQSIYISPLVGGYTQANSLDQLRTNADNISIKRQTALTLGGNLELGFLRASVNYVSGATVQQKSGVNFSTTGDIGKGKILMGAVDAVIRPIPRIVVFQPYALAGIGFKKFDYDISSTSLQSVKNNSTAAFHAGLGADLMFAGVGVLAEVTDYISKGLEDASGKKQLQHDAYGMVGLRLRL
jgi:opacity protein-like surface antigen